MAKKILIPVVVLTLVAAAAYFAFFAKRGGASAAAEPGDDAQAASLIADAAPAAPGGVTTLAPEKRKVKITLPGGAVIEAEEVDDDDMSLEDEKRMEAISDALDKDEYKAVAALIADVQSSTNAEVRTELVDALASFGANGLVDLLPFMADPDPEVAENARDQWAMALSDVTSEKTKCKYIESAMRILTDEDSLESMMTELTDCDDRLAIQTIVNIVASGTPQAVAAAKEQYEFITGEEYTNIADAETWLKENYEPEGDAAQE